MIRGHHIYKEIWTPLLEEALVCRQETDNFHDWFAVAVMKGSDVVGHVPKKILSICSLFLRRGAIRCEVIGTRQYSSDLNQGGLEVPCKLTFTCSDQERLATTRKLLDLALRKNECELPSLKRIKLEPEETYTVPENAVKCKVKVENQEGSSSGLSFMTKEPENLDLQWVKTG